MSMGAIFFCSWIYDKSWMKWWNGRMFSACLFIIFLTLLHNNPLKKGVYLLVEPHYIPYFEYYTVDLVLNVIFAQHREKVSDTRDCSLHLR